MNQAIRKLSGLLVLPVLLAALLLLPVRANAEDVSYECDATIPVTMQLNGNHDEKFTVTIELAEGAEETQPMPEADQCSLVLGKDEKGAFSIHYTKPGDYRYVVRQTAGSTAYMTYDAKVYVVNVRVTNAENGGLTALVWAWKEENVDNVDAKEDAVSFLNTYAPPTPKPDDHPDIAEAIENGTWGTPTPKPATGWIPQTSDSLPLVSLIVVLVVAAVAIVALVVARKRSGKKDEDAQE